MRIFTNLNEAYEEIRRDLKETGVWIKGHSYQDKVIEGNEDFDFMELSPYSWVWAPVKVKGLESFITSMDLNSEWITAELSERLTVLARLGPPQYFEWFKKNPMDEVLLNPGEAWKLRLEVWDEFREFDGSFSYTYADRFTWGNQFRRIVAELRAHPNTRQAILGMHHASVDDQHLGGFRRVPCSMFYHFMVRNEKLNLHYVMRSCDIHTHFPYDVVLAIKMQLYVAQLLERESGVFSHYITSLHGFRKDFGADVF